MEVKIRVYIIARTGKGKKSRYKDVKKTQRFAFLMAKRIHGHIVYGKGFIDGTELVLER